MRILLLAATTLFAQDADLVLRTAVVYGTQQATLPLSDAQRAEVAKLGEQAQAAGISGRFREAMRDYTHGLAVMRGVEWTPSIELASSIQARVDDAIAQPGQTLELTLDSIFPSAPHATTEFSLVLRGPAPATGLTLPSPREISASDLPLKISVKLPPDLSGNYDLIATLGGKVPKGVPLRIANLDDDAAKLAARLKKQPLPAAAYTLTLYDHAEHGRANPQRFDFPLLFAEANQLLDTAATGKDPFAGRQGVIRQAYVSTVDKTLQPYRLFVPTAYQGKPLPLVVALHGMGGDETSMMDGYGGTLRREAERLGFFLVTPKGREPASMYRGSAEKDVLDVLAEVERTYKIDTKHVFLMGHSMGGYGTWSIAMNHPELFAALGPISGGGDPQGMAKIKHIPQIVIHGDNDKTVNVTQSRNMVEAGRKAGTKIEYIEVHGGSHVDIAIPNFPAIFDFFGKQLRPATVAE
jgi:predicted esterase